MRSCAAKNPTFFGAANHGQRRDLPCRLCSYPHGGGSYTVAHENLGEFPGLVAASSRVSDYLLTVAVSITAGTAVVSTAFGEKAGFF